MATEKNSCAIDIERGVNSSTISNVKNWMVKIEKKAQCYTLSSEEKLWKNASIYQVPAFARDLNSKAFTPEMVSFGPYHHDVDELKLIEVHKERALIHFVMKAGKPLEKFVSAVEGVVPLLQDSYYGLNEKWKTDTGGFLMLMITDGCFMLEVLHTAKNESGYSPTDPLFSQHGIHHRMPYIRRDMLLIENQLPLLLLKTLVSVEKPEIPEYLQGRTMNTYIHNLVFNFVTGRDAPAEEISLKHHALDLYRQSLLCPSNTTPSNRTKQPVLVPKPAGGIRCATELSEAGVRFRKSPTKRLGDIRFSPSSGKLYLPELNVDDTTECAFLNIIAFEHLHVDVSHDITSYICFMDEIIDSPGDVSLLYGKGIIQNALGSYKEVAGLFNRISKEVTVDPQSSLNDVRTQVQKYCQKKQNKWRANLLHTYFRNPWSALSLAGALLVIVLTICQTVYAVIDHYHPN